MILPQGNQIWSLFREGNATKSSSISPSARLFYAKMMLPVWFQKLFLPSFIDFTFFSQLFGPSWIPIYEMCPIIFHLHLHRMVLIHNKVKSERHAKSHFKWTYQLKTFDCGLHGKSLPEKALQRMSPSTNKPRQWESPYFGEAFLLQSSLGKFCFSSLITSEEKQKIFGVLFR